MNTTRIIRAFLLLLMPLLTSAVTFAADESYVKTITGKISKGDSCTVVDDKFVNLPLVEWNNIRHVSVVNSIVFELRKDTNIYYHNRSFTCTLTVAVKYFSSRDQLRPTETDNIKLIVRYDTTTGKFYKVYDTYEFKNAYKVTVVVKSIESPEWGDKLPSVFRIRNQINVQRVYPFSREVKAHLQIGNPEEEKTQKGAIMQRVSTSALSGMDQISITWEPLDFPGSTEYDVEWTFVDKLSEQGQLILTDPSSVTEAMLEEWMRFDNSRVTVYEMPYAINLPFTEGYLLVRVRGVAYNSVTGLRETTNWQYNTDENDDLVFQSVDFHEEELNWQYVATYAEEGKRKEVISYFDAVMRNRQMVTINNRDQIAIAAETVYDNMGRPALNIMPAPVLDQATVGGSAPKYAGKLQFYPAVNKNTSGDIYSYADISAGDDCDLVAAPLNTVDGASNYYSPQNPYLGADPSYTDYYFTKYLPNGEGYTFSQTQYTDDNTGRIRRQGGVGKALQIGNGHDSRYYYGKPLQSELYRLFGMEAGDASHYLKNMVVDPNGQVSISYLNASGKVIATALGGAPPVHMDALPSESAPESKETITQRLIGPGDFINNTGSLIKQSTATFLASVTGTYTLQYSIKPTALGPWNTTGEQNFCSNCYYDVLVMVKDDCGETVASATTQPFLINNTECPEDEEPVNQNLSIPVERLGEYTVTYQLRLSEDVVAYQTEYYIQNNTDLLTLQHFFNNELILADLSSCYSECTTCMEKLGSLSDFTSKMTALLLKIKEEKYPDVTGFDINDAAITSWITTTYNTLLAKCEDLVEECESASPCDEKLELMKNDVRPGGQYFIYNEIDFSIPSNENNVSILFVKNGMALNYKSDPSLPNLSFKDENGVVRGIKDVGTTTEMFIKAYLQHPEWADEFVKRHIEYCSYLWCQSNSSTYVFDRSLQEMIKTGDQAQTAGYFNGSSYLNILDLDPFFNGTAAGVPYKTAMIKDMINMSDVLRITFPNTSNVMMVPKSIQGVVEWMLYCKPTSLSATATDWVNSWTCATPSSSCRSLTAEWEMFRQYYLQLKSKYVRLAKQEDLPECENCFIGQNQQAVMACDPPGELTDYSLTGTSGQIRVIYESGTLPFKSNYRIKVLNTSTNVVSYLFVEKGATQSAIIPGLTSTGNGQIQEIVCISPASLPGCSGGSGGGSGYCEYVLTDFVIQERNCQYIWSGSVSGWMYDECEVYVVYTGGTVATDVGVRVKETLNEYSPSSTITESYVDVIIPAGQSEVYVGQSIYSISRPSWPNHFIEARTYGTSDYICYPPPFDCPDTDDFGWELGGEACIGLPDGTSVRVFYSGSALNLPFPANKKITVTVSITLSNSTTSTLSVVLNRNGQASFCTGGRGVSVTTVVVTNVLCEDITVTPPPSSDCTNDPRAPYYATKIRIYDEYVDYESGLDCQLNGITLPTNQTELDNMIAASIAEARLRAIAELADLKQQWLDQLRGVVAEENANDVANGLTPRFSSLADPSPGAVNSTIQSLVNNLELVAKKYIEIAPSENIRPASTLPSGQVASNGYSSFEQVFNAVISSTLIEAGFGPHLLDNPYPHDRTPVITNPNVRELSTGICTSLGNLKTRWTSAGSPGTFHSFLQAELGSDYALTADELADLESRCTNGCKLLKETLILPAVFAAPAPGDGTYPAWVTCTTVTNAYSDFDGFYPNVEADSKLYRVLVENYMNSRFGFSLGFDDYDEFKTVTCPANGNAVLYNKVRNSNLQYNHEMQCAEDILRLVFEKAAREYEYYIENERKIFRNNYISACLSGKASASLTSERYEYHYTLYYYDQSGNLVKTVPPEGVSFLTEEEIGQIEELQGYMQYGDAPNPADCVNETMPATEDVPAALTAFSEAVEDDEAKAVEMWIYAASPGDNRQVRFTTPDNKYLYQAAIKDGKVWVELYSMVPDGSGSVSIVQTAKAVANLPYAYALQNWTNIVVQSATSLADGNLQLIVDGKMLTNLTGAAAWPYPFSWSVDASGGTVVYPENDLAVLRHMRMYNRVIDAEEAKYNYQNICLSPWGSLSTPIGEDGPLISWTRFNIPQPGDPGTISPSASSYSLQVFQDEETVYSSTLVSTVSNNFTVEFWAKPQSPITLHTPGFTGSPGIYAGMVGQRYAISPAHGLVSTVAGMGISVGTNGVQVAEHSNSYLPVVLSWEGSVLGWTHIAVVYNDRTPSLYINGVLVSTGIQSQKATVHPSANIQGNPLGVMDGLLDEIRVWNTVRSVGEIAEAMNLAPETGATGLAVYWPLENTSMIEDVVSGYDIPFWSTFYEWHEEGAPVSTRTVAEYNDRFIVPNHRLPTLYAYNSLNKVVSQTSPDGGTTEFWYDRLGRLVASQNSEQRVPSEETALERYSYTRYDELGRVIEIGESHDYISNAARDRQITEDKARTPDELQGWLDNNINRQVVQTAYDIQPLWAPVALNGLQRNLRKRVAASRLLEDGENLSAASYYNYDISGNLTDLYQQNAAQQAAEAGFVTGSTGLKHIKYDFDLVSGKINRVGYEDGKWDQFYQKYGYDAENRLISVASTRHDAPHTAAVSEATYRYYMHGPLARMELGGNLGNYQVQGLDYAYTLQGWIKGVNGKRLDPATAMADDGVYNGRFGLVARDVFGYSLGYFRNTTAGFEDYLPIGSSAPAFALRYNQPTGDPLLSKETGLSLYNGNISHATYALSEIESGATAGYTYRYDQLNRLMAVRRHTIGSGSTWDNTGIIQAYREDFSYDANGNIKTLHRNGADQIDNPLEMDELTYNYNKDANGQLVNNRLRHVNEVVDPENYTFNITGVVDLENQVADNYAYDKIGNLVSDQAEGISEIKWNVFRKIASISKTSGQTITYGYDPSGNRISKIVAGSGATETTYYVRDAQGNVLAVYKHTGGENALYTWAEQPLYGSSRIGMLKPGFSIESASPLASDAYVGLDDPLENSVVGLRVYELTNHLGNVMATISDRAEGHDDGNGGIDYYIAEVLSQQDYYAFGMQMPYRHFTHGNDVYRYGFNGKENDNDVKGEGNQQDYGMRIYDPRLGRFLSEDPLTQEYPWYTPYQFAGNTPIQAVDLDGSEEYHYLRFKDGEGKTVLALLETKDIISKVPDYYVSGRTVASPTIAGGYYSTGGYWVYKEVKNQKQEYYVWQNDRMINSSDVLGTPDVWEYDEKVKFNTYQEALNSTDKDFENTAEDNKMLVSQAAYNSAQEILDQSFQQNGRKLNRIAKALKSTQTQFHHLISRGLKNTNAFVQKAILGGFKIDGIGNLTPLERFLSKYNTGVHAKHPKYTKQIDEYLNGLEIDKFTPEKAKEFLEKINKHILKRIKENPSTKINDLGLDLKEFKP